MKWASQNTGTRLAMALILASVTILVGWQFRVPILKGSLLGSFVAPNTALSLILCGLSIVLQTSASKHRTVIGQIIGAVVLAFAIATLSEWILNADFGIDRIFFAHRLVDWNLPVPGRYAVNTCIGFILAGGALLTLRKRDGFPTTEVLSSLLFLVCYLSFIGYLYGVPALYATGNIMSLPTAILFTILSFSLIHAGSRQILGIVLSPYAGGFVSRRILSAIIILMPLLGWLEIRARIHNLLSREFGISLFVLVAVVVFTALTIRTAITLNGIDSQRLKSESALRDSENQLTLSLNETELALQRLELIQDTVNAGTWEFDIASGVSTWGPTISSLWGMPAGTHQIPFDDFTNLIYPEDRDRVGAVVQNAIATGNPYDVEFRVIWPDQSIHWLGARGAVVRNFDGTPHKIIGIALEVTERHQTEKALRESEKLAATGRLAATIAHEINNPLEAVVNLVYLAKNDPGISAATADLLNTADSELARVSHMVRQTLGFYRETSNATWIDLADMAIQIASLYRNKLQRKNIRLQLQAETARIYALEGEMRQVLSNLISNAIDAVEWNGVISVRVRTIRDRVRVIVADNGHGISPENRKRVFQPFFTTKKDVGTGLGLWVSKGIIEKHNGRIMLRTRNRLGSSGTAFLIELPVQAQLAMVHTANLAS